MATPAEDVTTKTAACSTNFIRAWRLYRGLERQQDLCALVSNKIKASVLSRLESGSLQYRQWHLDILAPALGCNPGDLVSTDPKGMGSILQIYENIPLAKRAKALKVLRNLTR